MLLWWGASMPNRVNMCSTQAPRLCKYVWGTLGPIRLPTIRAPSGPTESRLWVWDPRCLLSPTNNGPYRVPKLLIGWPAEARNVLVGLGLGRGPKAWAPLCLESVSSGPQRAMCKTQLADDGASLGLGWTARTTATPTAQGGAETNAAAKLRHHVKTPKTHHCSQESCQHG